MIETIMQIIEPLIHLDEYMLGIIKQFGVLTYFILFGVVFAETGLVVAPFLPGDSLLFIAGTLAGAGLLNIWIVYFSLLGAAIIGDTVNYLVGHHLGHKVFNRKNSRIFKKEYLEKTREFYEKHGGKAIILARFFPILRTFAPFVAGVGQMHYSTFLLYNVVGGFVWVSGFIFTGYYFGGMKVIQENFHYAVVGIIGISLIPLIIEFIKYRRPPHLSQTQMKHATFKDINTTLKEE